jgi:hypothetical protein
MSNDVTETHRSWTKTFEVAGGEVVGILRKIVAAGNVRRIILRNAQDHRLIEIPLTAGVAAGTIGLVLAPVWVAIGAMAALLGRVKVEIVWYDKENDQQDQPQERSDSKAGLEEGPQSNTITTIESKGGKNDPEELLAIHRAPEGPDWQSVEGDSGESDRI